MENMTPSTILINGAKAHYIHNNVKKVPSVILLHGQKFTAKTWVDTGLMAELAKNGYSTLSINLPGSNNDGDLTPPAWFEEVLNRMKIPFATIVAPSIAGHYGLPFAMKNPRRISGFVATGTTLLKNFANHYNKVNFPMLSLWGENDTIVPNADGKMVASYMQRGKYVEIEGGGHTPYVTKPEEYNKEIINFLKENNIQ